MHSLTLGIGFILGENQDLKPSTFPYLGTCQCQLVRTQQYVRTGTVVDVAPAMPSNPSLCRNDTTLAQMIPTSDGLQCIHLLSADGNMATEGRCKVTQNDWLMTAH